MTLLPPVWLHPFGKFKLCWLTHRALTTLISVSLLSSTISSPTSRAENLNRQDRPLGAAKDRFIRLNSLGKPLLSGPINYLESPWSCVLDRQTALVWEVKQFSGLQNHRNTYTWFKLDGNDNGGFAGYANGGQCTESKCDTNSYINSINKLTLCGSNSWRLPTREELRSLVDYSAKPPNPSINTFFFPNTQRQFYWSSTPDASDDDSAWGIGFTFGYDYSYIKRNFGHVRLVSESLK